MKRKRFRPRQSVEIDVGHLEQVVDKARREPLTEQEGDLLQSSIRTMAERLMPRFRTSERSRDLEGDDESPEGVAGAGEPAEKKRRKGHGRKGAAEYTGATVVRVAHPDLLPKSVCPCCEKGRVYERPPRQLVRIVGMQPIQATRYDLAELRCNLCGEIFTAPAPEGVGADKYDDSVTAMIALLKYGLGMTFYRIASMQDRSGVPVPVGTQCDLVTRAAEELMPVLEQMRWHAAQGRVLFQDDSGVRILDAVERPADQDEDRTGLQTTAVVSACDGYEIGLFTTGPQHAGENGRDLMEMREETQPPPFLMSDGLAANTSPLPRSFEAVLASCLVHARRNFVNVREAFPDECRYLLEELALVYRNDELTREQELDDEARLAYHQAHSAPVMARLKTWMEKSLGSPNGVVEANSALGKAMAYFLRRWDRLTRFLTHPGAPLDNNAAERALKKVVLHRKNALFFKTLNGAQVGDLYLSLIYTCELNKIDPFKYLTALLRHKDKALLEPAAWMPWKYHEGLALDTSGPN